MATKTRSKRQVKNESVSAGEVNNTSSTTHSVRDSDDDDNKPSTNIVTHTSNEWDIYREYEQQQLESIKLLTNDEMLNIEQWLLDLNKVYEGLRYPMLHRIWQTMTYLQDEERMWYEQEQREIDNDWSYFCKKLKQHICTRLKINIIPPKDHNLSSGIDIKPLVQTSLTKSSTNETNSSLTSALSITLAREIIKSPTYFRGTKDDVIEWLEKLEQRFIMANWPDELKLQYIPIHLQDDAYRWWNQSSTKITTWSGFVDAIKQAFGSTKLKELTFEQLRTYKQTINQSITQYYDKVMELCKRVDTSMTDSMKLQYLLAGVKQSLKLHIALYDPQTAEAFLSYARKVEDTLSLTNIEYDLNQYGNVQNANRDRPPIVSTVNHRRDVAHRHTDVYRPQLQSSTSGRMNISRNDNVSYSSSSKNTTSNRSSGVCYTCGTPGHYSRDCARSHFH